MLSFITNSKKLELDGIFSFRGPQVVLGSFKPFPQVTEMALHVEKRNLIEIPDLLDTLGRLPLLERVSITLGSNWCIGPPQTITLPHVRDMAILALERYSIVPPIFGLIKLPNLTLLRLQDIPALWGIDHPIFPTSPFGEYLPSLTNLPDSQVSINPSIEFAFRNPQAVFSCLATWPFRIYRIGGTLWGTLTLHIVRRLVVDVRNPHKTSMTGGLLNCYETWSIWNTSNSGVNSLPWYGVCVKVYERKALCSH